MIFTKGNFFFTPPPNRGSDLFFWTFSKIDQTKSFQWSIMFSKVNLRLLNTFLILFLHSTHFSTLYDTKKSRGPKKWLFFGYFSLQGPYRAKWPKNSHFCRPRDFFVPQRVEKCVKCKNNIKNVFSNLKLTLENIMDHWNDLVWSIFEKVQKNMSGPRFGGGKKISTYRHLM